jgi:cytochrome c oxidase subunit IV
MTSDHAAEMTGHDAAEIDRHVRVYITVFVALMALTIITVAVSYLDLPPAVAITVALFVATIKGSLVACYFMHLISEKKLIYAVLVITVIKFVALLALPAVTHGNGYWIYE